MLFNNPEDQEQLDEAAYRSYRQNHRLGNVAFVVGVAFMLLFGLLWRAA
jgi:hypothetical protein